MGRRTFIVMVITALVLGAATTAGAGGSGSGDMPKNVKSRYASGGYNYFSGSSDDGFEHSVGKPVIFDVKKDERWVSILIEDTTGRPAPAQVGQDLDGDGRLDATWDVCGATEAPVEIAPGKDLQVSVAPGACGSGVEPASGGAVFVELFSPGRETFGGPRYKVTRDVNVTYAGVYYEDGTGSFGGNAFRIDTMPWERYITVGSEDASGQPVLITFYPENAPTVAVCGTTDAPLKLPPASELMFQVSSGTCDQQPAVATTGQVQITLSNQP